MEFIETYFERCRRCVPELEGSAAKWLFEDLIPGLSDIDTRFFVSDQMTVEGWCEMSMEVGRIHLELAREHKEWARILEHLPGVNLKWNELLDSNFYLTEFSQWSFYRGENKRLVEARRYINERPWSSDDESYHWRKIAAYFGPYDRTIDPPINLGLYENEYPLHSRVMHYFAPPVQSAVALLQKKTTPGKLCALHRAVDLFPHPEIIDLVLDLIHQHYVVPQYLGEPGLTELDQKLEIYLTEVVNKLFETDDLPHCPRKPIPSQLRQAVRTLKKKGPASQLFEHVRFARLMKGRLWFYGQEVIWFDSLWLIRNELNRLYQNFCDAPLRLITQLIYGEAMEPDQALEKLGNDLLDKEQSQVYRHFSKLARTECPSHELKKRALELSSIFNPFLYILEGFIKLAKERVDEPSLNSCVAPLKLAVCHQSSSSG